MGERQESVAEVSAASVIVVNWNGQEIIRPCLDSLLDQRSERPIEIIVVDNGSTDDSRGMLAREYPQVRQVALPINRGFAGGANAGIAAATGEAIVLLNNDAVADSSFVDSLVRALEANPSAGAVTGKIVLARRYRRALPGVHSEGTLRGIDGTLWAVDDNGEQLINSTGNETTRSANGRDRDWLAPATTRRPAGTAPGFSGGAVALRREALDQVGVFDDRFFMYYEDTDLSWRLRRAGWQIVYAPDAIVNHAHAASSGAQSDFFLFHNERNRLVFAVKNTPWSVVFRAAGRTVMSTLRCILRGDIRAFRRKTRAIASALRMLPASLGARRAIARGASVRLADLAKDLVDD